MNLFLARSLPAVLLGAALLLSFSNCGGGNAKPVDPGPVPTVAPTAAPEPPAPTDPRLMKSCAKFKAGDLSAKCAKDVPTFEAEVREAVRLIQAQKPEIFNGTQILSPGQFIVGVLHNLDDMGLCAYYDGEEIAVKNEEWFSDQYDVITSRNHVWYSYMSTCQPSVFPVPLPPLPGQQADCKLPPSREITCGKEYPSEFVDVVDAAIDSTLQKHPEYFDFTDRAPASTFVKIVNMDGYLSAVAKELHAKGLCTFWDGEEINVKSSNVRSEHIDIVLGDSYHRRGSGMYMSSCYPAAF